MCQVVPVKPRLHTPHLAPSSAGSHQGQRAVLFPQSTGSCGHKPDTSGPEGMSDGKRASPRVELLHGDGPQLGGAV